jgi:hypothetical protein
LTLQKTHAETTASIEKFLEAGTALVQNGRQSPQAGEQPEKAIIKDRQIEVRLFACWRMLILRDLVPPVQGSWHAFHRATFARVEGWNAEGKERHRQSWESDLFVVCHGSGTGALQLCPSLQVVSALPYAVTGFFRDAWHEIR